jgi:hypothetical protein
MESGPVAVAAEQCLEIHTVACHGADKIAALRPEKKARCYGTIAAEGGREF